MSFEAYIPRTQRCRINQGELTITTNGEAKIHRNDIEKIGVDRHVVILVDRGTRRLALRRPAERDDGVLEAAMKVKRPSKTTSGCLQIALGGPVRELGIAVKDVVGRHEVTYKNDGGSGLLIVQFGKPDGGEPERPAKRKKKGRG